MSRILSTQPLHEKKHGHSVSHSSLVMAEKARLESELKKNIDIIDSNKRRSKDVQSDIKKYTSDLRRSYKVMRTLLVDKVLADNENQRLTKALADLKQKNPKMMKDKNNFHLKRKVSLSGESQCVTKRHLSAVNSSVISCLSCTAHNECGSLHCYICDTILPRSIKKSSRKTSVPIRYSPVLSQPFEDDITESEMEDDEDDEDNEDCEDNDDDDYNDIEDKDCVNNNVMSDNTIVNISNDSKSKQIQKTISNGEENTCTVHFPNNYDKKTKRSSNFEDMEMKIKQREEKNEMLTKQQQHPFDLAPFITNWLNSSSDDESVGSETSSILNSKSKSQFHCLHNTENSDSISDDDEDNEIVRDEIVFSNNKFPRRRKEFLNNQKHSQRNKDDNSSSGGESDDDSQDSRMCEKEDDNDSDWNETNEQSEDDDGLSLTESEDESSEMYESEDY
jgi:hypothetical protein